MAQKNRPIHFLTVIGEDRPGIIAGITGILFKNRCNLEDINMTLLEGKFAMILSFGTQNLASVKKLKSQMEAFARFKKLECFWKGMTVASSKAAAKNTETYLIQAIGPDKTGIVYHISRVLAKQHLNIEDLNSKVLQSRKKLYALALETQVPKGKGVNLESLKRSLQAVSKKMGIEIQIKPIETLSL